MPVLQILISDIFLCFFAHHIRLSQILTLLACQAETPLALNQPRVSEFEMLIEPSNRRGSMSE